MEERIEFINQLFSLSSKMLERDLRQDEFHGGRVYINIYIYTRVVAIGFNNRKRGECWRMEGGEKIGGEMGLTGIALSVSVGLCR